MTDNHSKLPSTHLLLIFFRQFYFIYISLCWTYMIVCCINMYSHTVKYVFTREDDPTTPVRVQSNELKRWNTLHFMLLAICHANNPFEPLHYNLLWHSCVWAECASVKLKQLWQVLHADGSPIFPLFAVLLNIPTALPFFDWEWVIEERIHFPTICLTTEQAFLYIHRTHLRSLPSTSPLPDFAVEIE